MKKIIWRIISSVFVLAQIVVSVLCLIALYRMNILESWIVALATGLLVVVAGLCLIPVFIKKPIIVTRIICMVVSVACIAGGVFALRYMQAFNSFLDKVSLAVSEDSEAFNPDIDIISDPYIIYISGSDSRSGIDDPTARSDVNILIVMNPRQEKMLLVSIPRDTYLQLHGTTGLKDKLTHAGYNNNIALSKATLEDYLGVIISYTVRVSFDTVIKVVDEIDGIDIFSDAELWLSGNTEIGNTEPCHFVYGMQHIYGDCALRFARERKSYARGDKHRGENQQEVLTAIINKLTSSRDYLLRVPEILEIAADSFETSFTRDDITKFLRFQLNNGINWQIESIGLDGAGDILPTYTYGEDMPLWVMLPDEESYQMIVNKINDYLEVDTNMRVESDSDEDLIEENSNNK